MLYAINNKWRHTFDYFDHDANGVISAPDLRQSFLSLGENHSDQSIKGMLVTDGDQSDAAAINFDKFLAAIDHAQPNITRDEVKTIFSTLDIDRSGYLTAAKLAHLLANMRIDVDDADVAQMMAIFDLDGNNQISVHEFEKILLHMGYQIDNKSGGDQSQKADKNIVTKDPDVKLPTEINLSSLSGDVLEALKLFDLNNTGTVSMEDLTVAAELLKSSATHTESGHGDKEDHSLHWDPNLKRHGLSKYIRKVNHVALIVSDVSRSARFYSKVMGFQQIRRPNFDKHGAWFTMGNIELHLIKGKPVVESGDDLIVNHISLETNDIEKIPGELEKLGVAFRQNVSVPKGKTSGRGGTNTSKDSEEIVRQYFFRDPDGYYVEVCNCQLATTYCLGKTADLDGFDQNVKALTLRSAAVMVNITQNWVAKGKEKVAERNAAIRGELGVTDGNIEKIASLIGCTAAVEMNTKILENFNVRRSVYGDICQNESEESLRRILLAAGNDTEKANEIMQLRAACLRRRRLQPPAFYEQGAVFVTPPSFSLLC